MNGTLRYASMEVKGQLALFCKMQTRFVYMFTKCFFFVCLFVCVSACENEISSAVTETKQAEMRCVWGDVGRGWVWGGGLDVHVDCTVLI